MSEFWSGIDVGKAKFEASWVEPGIRVEQFGKIPHRCFDRTLQGVRNYLEWLDRRAGGRPIQIRVVMEATGRYSLELIGWLLAARADLEPALVHPKQARHFQQSLGLRNKTDAVDARSLGLMGQDRRPGGYRPLSAEYQALRDLVRHRRSLIRMRVAEQNRLDEAPDSKAVRRLLTSHLRSLDKLIGRVERDIRKTVAASDQLKRDVQLMETAPGVGWITAVTVLGELGDLRRYRRSRQIAAAAGLCPRNHQSGTLTRPARIDRSGPAEARAVLYMAAMAVCRNPDNRLARTYHHLIEDHHLCKRAALVAVMRKLLVLLRALVINGSPYQDDFVPSHQQAA
jgi:transposase